MARKRKVSMAEQKLTPELINKMKNYTGLKLRTEDTIFNEEVTRRAIIKFINGIGDPNPLWQSHEYAKNTCYGGIVAPPSFVFSGLAGVQFGWRGLAGFHIATDMKFYKPLKLNDKMQFEATYLGFVGPKESQFAGKVVIDSFEEKYFNQHNELVAVSIRKILRAERKRAREAMHKVHNIAELPHRWTKEEVEKIEEEVLSLHIRGAKTRYFEDVNIGDELPTLTKGPLGVMDMIAVMVAGLAPAKIAAHAVALDEYRRKPAWAFRDPITHAMESLLAVHYNTEAAKAMGLPYPYDFGTQRQCWYIEHLTDWMGDDGWLKDCYAEYRRFVFLSDVVRISSQVTKKFISDEGEPCVEIETKTINQRNENVMPGRATIVLPSRDKKTHPVKERI